MAQKLILPINKMRLTSGYKNANYKRDFGYTHYGVDCTDLTRKDKTVWGSGNGVITHAGLYRYPSYALCPDTAGSDCCLRP